MHLFQNFDIRVASPERRALLICARLEIETQQRDTLQDLLTNSFNWGQFFRDAHRHGMVSLLFHHACNSLQGLIPAEHLGYLSAKHLDDARQRKTNIARLRQVLQSLNDHGVPALIYKGPAVGRLAYGDVALRSFVDLDILIHRRDILRAEELLLGDGYRQHEEYASLSRKERQRQIETDCEMTFVPNDGSGLLDVHWAITPKYFRFPLEVEGLWERRVPAGFADDIYTTSLEDTLLLLAAHNCKHRWYRLEWVASFALLLRPSRKRPGIDWNALLARSQQTRSVRMLRLGITLAMHLYDDAGMEWDIPSVVLEQVRNDSVVQKLADEVVAGYLQAEGIMATGEEGETALREIMKKARFHRQARENIVDRMAYAFYFAQRVMQPQAREVAQGQSSRWAVPKRAWYLLRKYVPH